MARFYQTAGAGWQVVRPAVTAFLPTVR